jgi:hypothetical protein
MEQVDVGGTPQTVQIFWLWVDMGKNIGRPSPNPSLTGSGREWVVHWGRDYLHKGLGMI